MMIDPVVRIGIDKNGINTINNAQNKHSNYPRSNDWSIPQWWIKNSIKKGSKLESAFYKMFEKKFSNKMTNEKQKVCDRFCYNKKTRCRRFNYLCEEKKVLISGSPDLNWLSENFNNNSVLFKKLEDFYKKHAYFFISTSKNKFTPTILLTHKNQ